MPSGKPSELGNPFESIESAQEFVRLLTQAIHDAHDDVNQLIDDSTNAGETRRVEALRLVLHKLDGLLCHMGKSQHLLKDLRTLRRLLEGEVSAAATSDSMQS